MLGSTTALSSCGQRPNP
ncbi:hypothetical protein ACFLVR_05360 [Chloroflexota bacterium]